MKKMPNIRPKPAFTYTAVEMPLPKEMYDYIRAELLRHGYGHAVDDETGQIDMHGIALVVEPA